jgi:putative oxidoreductase
MFRILNQTKMELIKNILDSDAGSALNNWALLGFRVLLSIELSGVNGMKKFRGNNGQPEVVPNPLHLPLRLNALVATFSDTVVRCWLYWVSPPGW